MPRKGRKVDESTERGSKGKAEIWMEVLCDFVREKTKVVGCTKHDANTEVEKLTELLNTTTRKKRRKESEKVVSADARKEVEK